MIAARKKVVVVIPAFNPAATIEPTYRNLPTGEIDQIILVDDIDSEREAHARRIVPVPLTVLRQGGGYGAKVKAGCSQALAAGADVVVVLHPDCRYDTRHIPDLIHPILNGRADLVLGSRLIGEGALKSGMSAWRYFASRALTTFENLVINHRFSDLHTGIRAYSRSLLTTIAFVANADGLVFDSQMLAQAMYRGFHVTEIPIPARHFSDASCVGLREAVVHGGRTVQVMLQLVLQTLGAREYEYLQRQVQDVPFVAPPKT